jgi:GTPase SAR1 family protein
MIQLLVSAIFITGTAGSGKSVLTSRLLHWYLDHKSFPISINLDPGAIRLPYEPDVDIRDYIDINTLMENYDLGPNGSLLMASDMIATRLEEIQHEVNSLNPDFVIVDTPGQIELFVFRASGPYFVTNFQSDSKTTLFLYDGALVSSPVNYVSVALLASSVRLRLKIAQCNILTKSDLVVDKLKRILQWSSSTLALESALNSERDVEYSLLCKDLLRSVSKVGLVENLIPISSLTMDGMVNLFAALTRIVSQGEEITE